MPPRKIRVFLADDHAVVREGLKALVNAHRDMEVIGEAADGQAACELVRGLGPEVVVMDVSMPKLNGARATRELKEAFPEVKVLALTVHEDRAYLRKLFDAGASGYVLKRAAADELIFAIRTVAKGGTYLDTQLAHKLVTAGAQPSSKLPLEDPPLSERESEVLRLVAWGYSNKEVGSRLGISAKTVDTYKTRAMDKLGLKSRVDIVRYAQGKGWLEDP